MNTTLTPKAQRLSYQHDMLEVIDDESSTLTVEDVLHNAESGNLRLVGIGESAEGNLLGSKTDLGTHMPVIDLDIPHRLVPSSTPGHAHLYLDFEMSDGDYEDLIEVLRHVGIIADGNVAQFRAHGQTFVRKPHVKKGGAA